MKKALLVGMNEYLTQKDLRGCLNDVNAVDKLLKDYYGFNDTRKLINNEVDLTSLIKSVESLLMPIENENDGVRVIFIAGHGGRAIDTNNDEYDKIDENICLPNYDWRNKGSFLLDDIFGRIINNAYNNTPWLRIYVVLDTCHSGTGTREITYTWNDIESKCMQNGFKDPFKLEVNTFSALTNEFSLSRTADEGSEFDSKLDTIIKRNNFNVSKFGNSIEPISHVLLSGCADNQTCKDVPIQEKGIYHGIFTYTLTETLKKESTLTGNKLIEKISNLISEPFTQNPQLEGNQNLKNRPIFT